MGYLHLFKSPGKNENMSSSDRFPLKSTGEIKSSFNQMEGYVLFLPNGKMSLSKAESMSPYMNPCSIMLAIQHWRGYLSFMLYVHCSSPIHMRYLHFLYANNSTRNSTKKKRQITLCVLSRSRRWICFFSFEARYPVVV